MALVDRSIIHCLSLGWSSIGGFTVCPCSSTGHGSDNFPLFGGSTVVYRLIIHMSFSEYVRALPHISLLLSKHCTMHIIILCGHKSIETAE